VGQGVPYASLKLKTRVVLPVSLIEDLKTGTCSQASLVLGVNGCVQEKVRLPCCHWLATNAAFTAKVAACLRHRGGEDGRCEPLATLQNDYCEIEPEHFYNLLSFIFCHHYQFMNCFFPQIQISIDVGHWRFTQGQA